jgi:tellurite resistance protein
VPLTRDRLRYFRDDVRHPMTGPFPAYVPIVALLLTMHYALYLPAIATQVLCVVWVSVLVLMSAQMLAFWFSGSLRLEQVHPGYALPVIAGPYIAAVALIVAGLRPAAVAAVGLGTFFWLTLGAVIFVRLIAAPPVPRIASPTMSVIVTLPVTAGLAWFAVSGSEVDAVQYALVGVVVLLLVTQVFLVPTYVRTPFSLGFWAFSFPAAALASYAIRWASAVPGTAAAVVAVLALGAASLLIAGLAAASIARAVASIRAARSS